MKKLFELINKNVVVSKITELIKPDQKNKELPLITISREKGSGGGLVAFLVETELGKPWKVYHKQIVEQIAKETHLETKLIKEVDESNIPLIEEIVSDFFGKHYLTLPVYYKHLVKILSTIGSRGHAIIVGRGANFLFPDSLKVRIISEMEQRIKWVMEYEKVSRREAMKRIDESDDKRKEFSQTLFDHDIRKAHHYDLIIRTGEKLSIEDAADLIVLMAKKRFGI